MHSDILLNVISWLCRAFFSGTHQLFMASQETLVLITYCILEHFLLHVTSCKVWRKAGDTLQIIQTNQRRDHRPVVLTIRARLAYEGAPYALRHLWIKTRFLLLQHRESIATPSSMTWRVNYSDAFLTTHLCWTLMLYTNGYTAPCDKAAEKHFTRSTQKKRERP